jgi:hypothetical protein
MMIPFIAANNGKIAENDSQTGFRFIGDENQNAINAMNYVVDNIKARNYIHPRSPVRDHGVAIHEQLCRGEAVFAFANYSLLKNITIQAPGHETDFTFGIIPPPMGNDAIREGQQNYISVSASEVIYTINLNIPEPREVAAIIVALANRTTKTERLIEYEAYNTLQDSDSREMLEIMLANNVVDVSRVVAASRTQGDHGTTGAYNRILGQRATAAQAMQEMKSSIQAQYDVVNNLIQGITLS